MHAKFRPSQPTSYVRLQIRDAHTSLSGIKIYRPGEPSPIDLNSFNPRPNPSNIKNHELPKTARLSYGHVIPRCCGRIQDNAAVRSRAEAGSQGHRGRIPPHESGAITDGSHLSAGRGRAVSYRVGSSRG